MLMVVSWVFTGALVAGLVWWLRRVMSPDALEKTVQQVFGLSANAIAEQSRGVLATEKEIIRQDMASKQQAIELLVKQLKEELAQRNLEYRQSETRRVEQFGQLQTSLDHYRGIAEKLTVTTTQLSEVLSHNQARGEWGERIIEDLLTSNGLVENVHYRKQSKQTASTARPDITLLLPNNRTVPVDVKFPFAEIQKLQLATTKSEQAQHLKQFGQDLKVKIEKVAAYIDPERETLEYAILFVPNEMLFSFINQKLPELVDFAIAKRVLIVSPFTFLIVARTVLESYRNFMISDKLREVVKHIDEFAKEWTVFRDEFEKFGRSIETIRVGYEKLTTTRAKQLQRKVEKVEQYRNAGLLKKEQTEASE